MSKSELYDLLSYLDLDKYERVVVEIENKDKEIERLKEELNKYKYRPSSKINFDKLMSSRKEIERLNNVIDKTIEYINKIKCNCDDACLDNLLNILQGSDKE